MGLKTYEDIEKQIGFEGRNRKDDRRSNNFQNSIFENVSLGGKINKFLRNSSSFNEEKPINHINDITEYEKNFIKEHKNKEKRTQRN